MASSLRPASETGSFTLRAAAAVSAFMFVIFVLVLGFAIAREGRDAERRAAERALAASQVVSTNARWIWELSHQALWRIDEGLGPDIRERAGTVGTLMGEAIARLPGKAKAYVIGDDGSMLFSTQPAMLSINVSDREYFTRTRDGDTWHTSALLVSRFDNQQVFVFSKRLERSGRFAGTVVISFDVALLGDIWRSLGFDHLSTVSLIRKDGQLVARYPLADGPLDLGNYVLFTEYLPEQPSGTYRAISPADGIARIVGYNRVPGTDFVALASISGQSAYALFRRNTAVILFFAVPTALALAAAIAWLLRLLANDQRSRARLTETLELNRMLVRDTHHRVKNNLQAIMSIVRMHPLPGDLKKDLQNRIVAMAAVHEHLYRLDQFAEVDATTLIPAIVEPLQSGFSGGASVTYDIDPLVIDRDHATPLALLVNETATNALKYAFPPGRPGTIVIGFKLQPDGSILLSVRDNGIGFDPSAGSTGLGRRLIAAMVTQLGGTFSYRFDNGCAFEAILPAAAGAWVEPRPAAGAEDDISAAA